MDVDATQHHPRPLRLATAPALWVVDDVVDEPDVAALLALFDDEAFVTAHAHHVGVDAAGLSIELPAGAHPLLAGLLARIESVLGRTSRVEPSFRFRLYMPGQFHPPHTDCYEQAGLRLALTALVTLQGADAGGETAFPAAGPAPVVVAGRRGRLLAWTSTLAGGADDHASEHLGARVVAGVKAVLLAFVYLPAAEHDGLLELREDAAPA